MKRPKREAVREYYVLTKSGLVFGNIITVIAGFLLASRGRGVDFTTLVATIIGMCLIMASGCVFNNYMDRDIDRLMDRTKDRALVHGRIHLRNALWFGGILGVLGLAALAIFTNLLTVVLGVFGFYVYVFLYTKYAKRTTVYGTAVGAISGAIPPLVGYCAVSNRLDMGALTLFLIMMTWQMPHFFAIAIRREDDYRAAGVPVMPVKNGIQRTKVSMFIYIIEFTLAALLLSVYGYTGYAYFVIALVLGLVWLALSVRGFWVKGKAADRAWATNMFFLSLGVMVILFGTIAIGAVV